MQIWLVLFSMWLTKFWITFLVNSKFPGFRHLYRDIYFITADKNYSFGAPLRLYNQYIICPFSSTLCDSKLTALNIHFYKFYGFPLYGHSILIPYLPLLYEIQNRWRPIVIKCQIIFQFLYLYLFTYLIFTYICTITWLYYEIVAYTKSGSTLPTTTEG